MQLVVDEAVFWLNLLLAGSANKLVC